ncbi:hypothetical protein U879_02625 [Defluviimonas sp. 20V17]|uniref:Assimilatory nitrate reductase catalytic subunit n=1 Tax=Allgaiera indica TaxID=765699 RepID=A0AAN4UUE3_9RHOB|nr:molybdopterin-dependent oxidoreductase [Allgaiera indica]KDB05246.1 hypothetical protein U879_02625 [Defluviimonas sp. 20V17]GHE04984.1 hypothetical protein GCM10008024_34230 [Allgaiera indica]SDX60670.1 assimilatory nitrate reductase catalytic subunit [Allgaiera indica]
MTADADTDTARLADVLLPAAGWGEKDCTVTNSERRISRQRRFRAAPGEARPDWWALARLARRLGWGAAFDCDGPAAILREYAAMSGPRARWGGDFDILARAGRTAAQYDAMAPFTWPVRADGQGARASARFFARGGFFTPDRRARMLPSRRRRSPARPIRCGSTPAGCATIGTP